MMLLSKKWQKTLLDTRDAIPKKVDVRQVAFKFSNDYDYNHGKTTELTLVENMICR